MIYLRSTNKTPDKLVMHVEFPAEEKVAVDVPLLRVREYTKEQPFQKDLLLLLPYYLMRYEADLIIGIAMYLAPKNKKQKVRIMRETVIKARA